MAEHNPVTLVDFHMFSGQELMDARTGARFVLKPAPEDSEWEVVGTREGKDNPLDYDWRVRIEGPTVYLERRPI